MWVCQVLTPDRPSPRTALPGLQRLHRLRRPHSSSDAFPVGPAPAGSCESLSSSSSSSSSSSESSSSESSAAGLGALSGSPSHRTSAWLDDGDELDFSPPRCLEGLRGLDFDPLTFRCSSPTPGDPAPPASPAPPAPASAFPPRPSRPVGPLALPHPLPWTSQSPWRCQCHRLSWSCWGLGEHLPRPPQRQPLALALACAPTSSPCCCVELRPS